MNELTDMGDGRILITSPEGSFILHSEMYSEWKQQALDSVLESLKVPSDMMYKDGMNDFTANYFNGDLQIFMQRWLDCYERYVEEGKKYNHLLNQRYKIEQVLNKEIEEQLEENNEQ